MGSRVAAMLAGITLSICCFTSALAGQDVDPLSAYIILRQSGGDQTEELNAAIRQLSERGGGSLKLSAGLYLISRLVPLSDVNVQGVSQGTTKLRCGSAACIAQTPGSQLSNFRMSDVAIEPQSDRWSSSTAITLLSVQQSYLERISVNGFKNGTALRLGGVRAKKTERPELGSNVLWNHFRDITVFGCTECVIISGSYGSKPTLSPADSGNEPDQVVTANVFDNFNLMEVKSIGWNIVRAADTNTWVGGLVNLSAPGATGVVQGGDRAYHGNTYANSNKFFGLAFSKSSDAKNVQLFRSFNFTFGLEVYGVETDISKSENGGGSLWSLDSAKSFRICGRGLERPESLAVTCIDRSTR